jgi:hypothetical protein
MKKNYLKKNIWCHLRTLEHHFSCPVRHKINNNVKRDIKITPIIQSDQQGLKLWQQ